LIRRRFKNDLNHAVTKKKRIRWIYTQEEFMFNNPIILVGTDFSTASDMALKAAEALRKNSSGTIHVVHIANNPGDWLAIDASSAFVPDSYKNMLHTTLQKKLEDQVKGCEVHCTYEVEYGNPSKKLNELIAAKKADMLILGHQGAGAAYTHIGGLTSKMVASAKVPVLVINKNLAVRKIAGLVDTARPMKNIFASAEKMAKIFSAELEFISLWKDLSCQTARRSPVLPTSHITYTEEERNKVMDHMRATIASNASTDLKSKINVDIIQDNNMASAIIQKLEAEGIDLAVMTRHKKGAIEEFFIGSVTKKVIDKFKGNLLILPSA
jgi:universal stress protein E